MEMRIVALLLCLAFMPATAQTVRRSVRATGEGSVSVRPDAARVSVAVVKQAATAADAASQNATAASAVIAAVRQLLGQNADVKTSFYSLIANYSTSRDGSPAQITGYTATNVVEAVASDPTLAGRVIDTAIGAGANRINNVQLFLRDDEPSRAQALRVAAQRARARADAIAMGLGVRLGQVLNAEQGYSVPGIPMNRIDGGLATSTVPTPIEAGALEVRAIVTVDVEIVP
jgi:uncharacterized protein YggE